MGPVVGAAVWQGQQRVFMWVEAMMLEVQQRRARLRRRPGHPPRTLSPLSGCSQPVPGLMISLRSPPSSCVMW